MGLNRSNTDSRCDGVVRESTLPIVSAPYGYLYGNGSDNHTAANLTPRKSGLAKRVYRNAGRDEKRDQRRAERRATRRIQNRQENLLANRLYCKRIQRRADRLVQNRQPSLR